MESRLCDFFVLYAVLAEGVLYKSGHTLKVIIMSFHFQGQWKRTFLLMTRDYKFDSIFEDHQIKRLYVRFEAKLVN